MLRLRGNPPAARPAELVALGDSYAIQDGIRAGESRARARRAEESGGQP